MVSGVPDILINKEPIAGRDAWRFPALVNPRAATFLAERVLPRGPLFNTIVSLPGRVEAARTQRPGRAPPGAAERPLQERRVK
jgi:hypothetical protein